MELKWGGLQLVAKLFQIVVYMFLYPVRKYETELS